MKTPDLREELKRRIAKAQQDIDRLKAKMDEIMDQMGDAEDSLLTWREAYELESEQLGKPILPLFSEDGKSYRFVGMKLTQALALIRKEQPEITKKQALKILGEEGFDFRGKRPLTAVHFAWIALGRRKKERR